MPAIHLDGAILDGKYRVGRQLGKGGMGAVYLATHLGTTRTVALKVIVPELASRDEFIVRFQREAEAAGRLRHPNVVNVTDFGITGLGGASLAYLVMEYLDGQTLGEYQTAHGQPKLDLAIEIVDQVALALDAAHAAGIVHRDLKPDNIWMESNRRGGYNVKVLDFGIAKLADPLGSSVSASEIDSIAGRQHANLPGAPALLPDETPTLAIGPTELLNVTQLKTLAGSMLGTPAYMSPEQCRGEAVDFRADIYSLAIITYELVSGSRPFHADTVNELLTMQVMNQPPSPEVNNSAIPKQVASAVLRGLEKDPAKRPASAGTFAALLRSGAEGDFGVLRKAKDLFHSYPSYFFPSFLLTFIPLAPALAVILWIVRQMFRAKLLPDAALMAILYSSYALTLLFCFQCTKAAAALLLREAIDTGGFRPATWRVIAKLGRAFPQLLGTQIVNLFDLRPRAFRDNILWPVVWAMEGRQGRAAIVRSAELSRTIPSVVLNFVPRQNSPGLVAILLLPAVFGIIGEGVLPELIRQTLAGGTLGWFSIFYPAMSIIFYAQYAIVFTLVYWQAMLCRGEASIPNLPATGTGREKKRNANLRISILLWWLMPLVMAALFASGAVRRQHSALLDAIADGRGTQILKAIDGGANIETKDAGGVTPLLAAARNGDLALVQALLARGAKVTARTSSGATALIVTTLNHHPDIAAVLLDHGAQVDIRNEEGRTALCYAALRGNADLVRVLLAHGANPRIADVHGKTPLDYARDDGHDAIVKLLEGS